MGNILLRILDQLSAQLRGFFFQFFSIFGVVIPFFLFGKDRGFILAVIGELERIAVIEPVWFHSGGRDEQEWPCMLLSFPAREGGPAAWLVDGFSHRP